MQDTSDINASKGRTVFPEMCKHMLSSTCLVISPVDPLRSIHFVNISGGVVNPQFLYRLTIGSQHDRDTVCHIISEHTV